MDFLDPRKRRAYHIRLFIGYILMAIAIGLCVVSLVLNEHRVSRYVYPFLFPVKPVVSSLRTYASRPPLFTESPDQHWLLAQLPADGSGIISFDEYDTTSLITPP